MPKVIRFGADVPAEVVLQRAAEAGLKTVMVLGFTHDEQLYTDVSFADGGEALWLIRRAEHAIMQRADELEDK